MLLIVKLVYHEVVCQEKFDGIHKISMPLCFYVNEFSVDFMRGNSTAVIVYVLIFNQSEI